MLTFAAVFRKNYINGMKTRTFMTSVMLAFFSASALAGGILTNTNQSIDFLRNPARDAAIGLDGVYSNPAGVAFLSDGLHLGFNWQYAHQTRTITTTNPTFALGRKNNGASTKQYEGVADAPCIPSIQAAYNTGNWSLQFNFSVPGGGGKCEFADGLGSFESVVGGIAGLLKPFGAQGYDMDGYMQGRQYYFGFQLGAAYKATDNLSVYGGLRMLYGTATYKARIRNIQVNTVNGYLDFGDYLTAIIPAATAAGYGQMVESLEQYSQGVNLLCNQSGVGIAPIVGVDYRLGRWNFAAKYEFKTQMRMKNESTVFQASQIDAVNKYQDGEEVNEDAPALLTLGVQWNPIDPIRVNVGWHYYFDKQVDWYNNAQDKLDHNTNEFLLGAEWDINDRLTISCGGQLTRYGLTDEYMNDMSFIVNSYSIGFGANYKLNNSITLKGGFFQTEYETKDVFYTPATTDLNQTTHNAFTRTNRVLGIGCDICL